jgi:hypothetical protein
MTVTKGFVTGAATTALDTRKADAEKIATDASGNPRIGLLTENPSIVTSDPSTAPMRLAVAAAGIVTERSAADGVAHWANDGTVFVTVTKPGSNSHYVVVYVKHNDTESGDGSSLPELGVVTGAAGAVPAVPAVPAGAREIARALIPSTATSTQSGGVVITNTYPMTAMRGGVVPLRNGTEEAAWSPANGAVAYRQDTERLLVRVGGAWRPVNDGKVLVDSGSFGPVSTLNLDNVFSSAFDAYTVEVDADPISAKSVLYGQLRSGGVAAATGYYHQLGLAANLAVSGGRGVNIARWQLTTVSGDQAQLELKLTNLAAGKRTMGLIKTSSFDSAVGPDLHAAFGSVVHGSTSAYDGLAITTNGAPTFSGNYRVYGHYAG